MDKEKNTKAVSEENIYCLNGRVPVKKAIPFGLQHVLAMFVSNLAPVLIVCSAAFVRGSENHLSAAEITQLLQCAMFAAGIGTCLQLYPVWKIGSRLPIVMGVSFTFLGSLLMICTNPELGYEGMVGAVIAGGIFEGLVGMSAKYWKRLLTPVVSACVVIAIGLSLLSVGMDSWGGGNGAEDFGAWYHLLVGFFTLVVCLAARYLLKGVYKNLNVLVGLVCGYLLSIIFTVAGVHRWLIFQELQRRSSRLVYSAFQSLYFLLPINRFLIWEHSLLLQLYSWYRQRRQRVQLLQCVPVHLDGISRWRNCRGLLPWMDFPVRFQDALDVCRLLLSVRISGSSL